MCPPVEIRYSTNSGTERTVQPDGVDAKLDTPAGKVKAEALVPNKAKPEEVLLRALFPDRPAAKKGPFKKEEADSHTLDASYLDTNITVRYVSEEVLDEFNREPSEPLN